VTQKKTMTVVLVFLLLLAVAGNALAVVPGYENTKKQYKIAEYTLEFLHADGRGGVGTFPVFNDPRYTDDEVIEITLEGCWITNATHIRQITHVNGVPIGQTKWAKYGGIIQHIGGNITPIEPPKQPEPEQKEITVFVQEDQVMFPDQKPIIIGGRTMVPVRAVFEHKKVQAEVTWDAQNRTVTAEDRNGRVVVFRIGENDFRVEIKGINAREEYKYADVAPVIENGRTLLPLRALSEALEFQVDWIEAERKVEIKEKSPRGRRLMPEDDWEEYLRKGR
jgi:hypothetical protein